jgi:GT2 family glycosyltransferase
MGAVVSVWHDMRVAQHLHLLRDGAVPLWLRLPLVAQRCVWQAANGAGLRNPATPRAPLACETHGSRAGAAADGDDDTPASLCVVTFDAAVADEAADAVRCGLVVPVLLRDAAQARQLAALLVSVAALRMGAAATLAHVVIVDDGSPAPVTQLLPAALRGDVHVTCPLPATHLPAGTCEARTLWWHPRAEPHRRLGVTVLRRCRNAGPAAARNAGVRALLALRRPPALLLFTDADVRLSRDWLGALASAAAAHPDWRADGVGAVLVAGRTLASGPALLTRYHNTFGTLNGRLKGGALLYACTCNLGASRGVFQRCAVWFNEAFPSAAFEDCAFCVALARTWPHAARFVPNAIAVHDFAQRPAAAARAAYLAPVAVAALMFARMAVVPGAASRCMLLLLAALLAAAALAHFLVYACAPLARQSYRYARSQPLMLHQHPDFYQLWRGSLVISNEASGVAAAAVGA